MVKMTFNFFESKRMVINASGLREGWNPAVHPLGVTGEFIVRRHHRPVLSKLKWNRTKDCANSELGHVIFRITFTDMAESVRNGTIAICIGGNPGSWHGLQLIS
jgi:hypothetical protein